MQIQALFRQMNTMSANSEITQWTQIRFSDKNFALSLEATRYEEPENEKISSRDYCIF